MTQYNEGKGYERIKTINSLSLKIQEVTLKNVAITEKKGPQYVRQIIYINQKHLPTKDTHVQINQSFSLIFKL